MRRRLIVLVLVLSFVAPVVPAGGSELLGVAPPPGGRFFDDDGSTHEGSIEAIANAGITLGCNAPYQTGYCPEAEVTRAQMATFLARALDLPIPAENRFTDVSGTHAGNINAIAAEGITLGCDQDGVLFCPDELVSRAQMASFLARGLSLPPTPGDRFTDVSGTHAPNIYAIAAVGITLGCEATGTLYCPDATVRRDQMASFLARGLDLGNEFPAPREHPLTGTWLDIVQLTESAGCVPDFGTTCAVDANVSGEFFFDTYWFAEEYTSATSAEQEEFAGAAFRVEARLDGVPIEVLEWDLLVEDGDAYKYFSFQFPAWLSGAHILEVIYVAEAPLSDLFSETVVEIHLTLDGGGYPLSAPSTGAPHERQRTGGLHVGA